MKLQVKVHKKTTKKGLLKNVLFSWI